MLFTPPYCVSDFEFMAEGCALCGLNAYHTLRTNSLTITFLRFKMKFTDVRMQIKIKLYSLYLVNQVKFATICY